MIIVLIRWSLRRENSARQSSDEVARDGDHSGISDRVWVSHTRGKHERDASGSNEVTRDEN